MKTTRFLQLLAIVLLSIISSLLPAAEIDALVKDTQRMITNKQRITLVWWIPEQFWEESFRQQGGLSAEQKAEFKKVMAPYTVFCVAVLDVGPVGGLTGKSREALLANTKLRLGQTVVPPLKPEEISGDASNFYAMMKPMFANMMGQIGQGMEFLVYRKDELVAKNLDPLKTGSFEYEAFGEVTRWRLPLGSLLPKKFDTSTAEEFPGDYNFSPYTGKKLEVKPQP